ncbi:hypothetical protein J2S40_001129 [Nocardioides luteus]|uniref:Uncharacterized protein n=1 Tax=Nocardioides luteus TaxID=1844 RepID=A0ABQ5STP7_9ACTN|nr:hypothetical protein [Nocardioides luteus]MDR7310071.1 hypothetical protein [Nocardioides luteus]GGR65041.1 hypothetical protein GCM10010197_35590 [Nocardioides luteus]GLJ67020.1 hypothetical protein GCM10017579_10560 [Nocardioides luteus]
MTTAIVLIVFLVLAGVTTAAAVHGDRPKAAPRSHNVDPDFLPAVRWH